MNVTRRLPLNIVLLSIALLVGQYAALAHASKHPFHESVQSCQVFFALEKSELGLISDGAPGLSPVLTSGLWVDLFTQTLPRLHHAYSIRAPPSLP